MPIEKYFEIIDECIQYEIDGNHPYTLSQIINNYYNTVLYTVLYTENNKMWRKKLSSENTWDDLKKFFAEEYNHTHKLKRINATQEVFHGTNMSITMKYDIFKTLEKLVMVTTSEKDVITKITITIIQLSEAKKYNRSNQDPNRKKCASESNGGHQKKKTSQASNYSKLV